MYCPYCDNEFFDEDDDWDCEESEGFVRCPYCDNAVYYSHCGEPVGDEEEEHTIDESELY